MQGALPPSAPPATGTRPTGETRNPGAAVDVSIVIPAFNEQDGVGVTVDRVRAALSPSSYSFEIIVVDDGSTDDTRGRADTHGARVVRQSTNHGYGAALKTGIASSAAEFIVIIDADGTYPPEVIPSLIAKAADADMVVGARTARDASIPVERRPAKWLLTRLASYLAEQPIPDLNSGLRVFRRALVTRLFHILPPGFSFTTTMTLALLCTSHRVVYEPVLCAPRIGRSKLRAADFTSFVVLVLRTVVLFNPLRVFLPAGTVLFAIGCMKLAYDISLWNLSETAVMSFLAAAIVWSLGLLADLIARLQLQLLPPP